MYNKPFIVQKGKYVNQVIKLLRLARLDIREIEIGIQNDISSDIPLTMHGTNIVI